MSKYTYKVIDGKVCIMHEGIGHGYSYFNDPERVCQLLNEKRDIDKDCKEKIISHLEERLHNLKARAKGLSKGYFLKSKKSIESGLEVIKSLPVKEQ